MKYEGQTIHKVISTTNRKDEPVVPKVKVKEANYLMANNRPLELLDLVEFEEVSSFADMWSNNKLAQRIDMSMIPAIRAVSCMELCSNCGDLIEIVMPSSAIGNLYGAFSGCSSLEKVLYPEGFDATEITDGRSAFYNCVSLTEFDLQCYDFKKANSSYGNQNFFMGCKNLRKIWVPKEMTIRASQEKYGLVWKVGNDTCTIYTDATEKMPIWGAYWNSCDTGKTLPIVWGASHMDYENA